MISDRTLRRILPSNIAVRAVAPFVRLAVGAAVVILVSMWLVYYAALAQVTVGELHMNDFGKFYYSAQYYLEGRNMYGASPATLIPVDTTESRHFWNLNPPHFHLLILPFAMLAPGTAVIAWSVVNLLALALAAALIVKELQIRISGGGLIGASALIVISSPMDTIIATGQFTFLLMVPVTLAWIAARRGQWERAAVIVGLLASIKPFFGIFWVYLVLRRQVRAAVAMAGVGAACFLVGLLVFGWQAHVQWLNALSGVEWSWAPMNGSIAGIVARMFADSPLFDPLVSAPTLVRPITALGNLAILVASAVLLRRQHAAGSADIVFAVLLLVAQLVSPLGWIYYLPLVAGPLVGWWRGSRMLVPAARWLLWLSLPGLILPHVFTAFWRHDPWAGPTIGSIYFWSTLFIWAAVFAQEWVRRSVPAAAFNMEEATLAQHRRDGVGVA